MADTFTCPRCGVIHERDPRPEVSAERRLDQLTSLYTSLGDGLEKILSILGNEPVSDRLNRLGRMERQTMASIQEVQTKIQDLANRVSQESTLDQSILTLLNGLTTANADIKAQLDAAIAANNPQAIQAAADQLDAVNTAVQQNIDSLTAAVPANTPAATADTGGGGGTATGGGGTPAAGGGAQSQ